MAMPQDLAPEPRRDVPGDVCVFFDPGCTLIRLSGEVDLSLADDLEFAGRDAIDRGVPVEFDVEQVTYIDSVGLGFMARVGTVNRLAGRPVVVRGAGRRLLEAISLVGLDDLFVLSPPSSPAAPTSYAAVD